MTRLRNVTLHAPDPGIGDDGRVLDDWIAEAKSELGIDLEVDVPGLLDMTKDVAHGVARPAAPLTAFLVGYAAAQAGGGPGAVAEANRKVAALARRWAAEQSSGAQSSGAQSSGGESG